MFYSHDWRRWIEKLWVLQHWDLSDDEYGVHWIHDCPIDPSEDGQLWAQKQSRHRVHGGVIFFLESVRHDGPTHVTERWVCHGWRPAHVTERGVGIAKICSALALLYFLYRLWKNISRRRHRLWRQLVLRAILLLPGRVLEFLPPP